MDAESVNQIVKAITSLHDGRTWKPETVVAAVAALAAAGAAIVTLILGKRQIALAQTVAKQQVESAQEVAQKQTEAALEAAKLQIKSAQQIAQEQIESAQAVARLNLAAPMRKEWANELRGKLASFLAHCFSVYKHPETTENDTLTVATLSFEVSLMLDPMENVHRGLTAELQKLTEAAGLRPRGPEVFEEATQRVRAMAHFVLKG
jgi:hypothetical protein